MRLAVASAVAFVVLAAGTTVARNRTVVQTATSSVSGRVTVADGERLVPVRRARVTVTGSGGGTVTVDTDTDGRYRADGIPAGDARVLVDKPGFVMPGAGSARTRGARVTLTDEGPATLDITMRRGAALSGTVYNERGQPVEGLVVTAVRFGFTPYGRHPVVVTQTQTNGAGQYRLHTLAAGEYYVRAAPEPLNPYMLPKAPDDPPRSVAPTYYPGTPQPEQARALSIDYGDDLASLDLTLTSVPVARLDGAIVDSAGAAPPSYTFRMQAVGGPINEVRGFLNPQGSGFFIQAVPPGEYWLSAVAAPTDTRGWETVITRVAVAGVDMTGLELRTAPGRPVTGRVEVAGGASALPEGLHVVAHEMALELPTPRDAPPIEPPLVDATGAFTFTPLFGPRLLRLDDLPAGWALEAVTMNGTDIADTPVDFQQDAAGPVQMIVTHATGTVRGTVTDAAGQPASGVRVVVFDPQRIRWGALSRHFRTVETGADGRYIVEGLLPGAYEVVTAATLDGGPWHEPWRDPAVVSRLATGAPHAIGAGDVVTVDLTVER